jgi:type I restriction enzyme, S subunit
VDRGGTTGVPLGAVLALKREPVRVDPPAAYPNLGLYSFGRGAFVKPPILGDETSATTLYRVRAGQLIYSRLFAFEGAFAVVPDSMDGWYVSNEYPAFEVDAERADVAYLRLLICRPSVWADLSAQTVGMGHRRQRLQPDALLRYEVSLPPLEYQRDVVAAADAAAAVLHAAHVERDTAFDLLNAAVERLIVPAGSWEELPDGWQLSALGEVADVRGGMAKGRKTGKAVEAMPFLRAANVQNGYLDLEEIKTIEATKDEADRFRLEEGDVLMVEGSGSPDRLGRGWIWEDDPRFEGTFLHQNHVFRARPQTELVEPRFLAYAIAASPARAHFRVAAKTTSGLATINKTQTAALPVVVPPLDEQREIVGQLDVVRAVAVSAHRRVQSLGILHTSLVEALIGGSHIVSFERELVA